MDLHSPEFYTLAFVVAMALVALLLGQREKQPPSTYIVPLTVEPAAVDQDDRLTIEPGGDGSLVIRRTGLSLGDEETVHLVITVQDDRLTIVEKKGVRRRGAPQHPVTGQARLKKGLRPHTRYRLRYESQLTSAWAILTFDTASPRPVSTDLRY